MIKRLKDHLLPILFFFLAFIAIPIDTNMQPIKRDGCYYYSVNDTHQHINLRKALSFLYNKLANPLNLLDKIKSLFQKKKLNIDATKILNPNQSIPQESTSEPTITWIGHASFLIQINGLNILTDPILGDVYFGPLSLSKRTIKPGITLENLPPIDAIVISHNHTDHLDTATLTAIQKKYNPAIYIPDGNGELAKSIGFSEVVESSWWHDHTLTKNNKTIKITCLPAYHWSIRFSLDSYRKTLWASWLVSDETTSIYFAGDTAYGSHFQEISKKYPNIDIALMPIGPTGEKENTHSHSHIDAIESLKAFNDLNAQCFVPMHYGTFFLSKENLIYPILRLHNTWQQDQDLKEKHLLFAQCGTQYTVSKNKYPDTQIFLQKIIERINNLSEK